jgi:flagellin
MTINNNPNTYNNIHDTNISRNSALQRIATGLLINQASDNASGLAIADQLRTQGSTISQTIDNATSGIAMANIAQGGMREQQNILGEINTLTLQAMNGTTSLEGREAIEQQINKYIEQYENIAEQTNYNGTQLLQSSGDPALDDLSISGEDEIVNMEVADTTSISDTLKTFMSDFSTNENSRVSLLDELSKGMSELSSMEADFGTASNALQSSVRNYMTAETNMRNAESVIRDLDFANGVANFNKTNLQAQAGYFAQSQANAVQSRVISLLS